MIFSERYSDALLTSAIQDHLTRTLDLNQPVISLSRRFQVHNAYHRPQNVRPVVDSGLRSRGQKSTLATVKTEVNDRKQEHEYVLTQKRHRANNSLTLAEKIGLVETEKKLSEAQWLDIKVQSNKRDDSSQPCVICKEEFGLNQQVLLSCSHVFHRNCLEAFESYSRKKCCPMCRRVQYEKRIIYEGANCHRIKCASKIQALWRGYITRQWYKRMRKMTVPIDPKLREKFYSEKLAEITDRIVLSCDFNLNDLFSEIDRTVEQSRRIGKMFDEKTRQITDDEWSEIRQRAQQRREYECSICKCLLEQEPLVTTAKNTMKKLPVDKLQKLFANDQLIVPKNETKLKAVVKRPLFLLSCTHVFHSTCLETFEQLCCDQILSCPVCRTAYQKKSF
ncbi:unnamed protein product [Didymodactylos carnosus]|uniref:RING-type domain-containing protein n=1 Tax=Didymodactylos carnosus TaxID=1234261 RepID=A0A8S2GSA4_9BILA|nr:unnamed protein product [Didymodactylos carnosus]CAF3551805.1 unnamed protein product [Didymodactylos carnosus]